MLAVQLKLNGAKTLLYGSVTVITSKWNCTELF